MSRRHLVIVDGYYFLYRNFYAQEYLYNSDGMNCNALSGMSYSLQRARRDLSPTHMVVVLDSPEPTFRHLLCPGYKEDRVTPEELQPQIEHIEPMLEAMDLPYIRKPGFEGDDLIGSLAKWFEGIHPNHEITILSGDKDLTQLVNKQITVEDIFNKRIYSRVGVHSKFGVYPEQMIDYLTLVGDSADSVKGVNGIGAKTAASLLEEFESLDNILNNLNLVKPKIAEALLASLDGIKKDRTLVTIVTDLEIEMDLEEMHCRPIDPEKIIEFKRELFK